MSTVCIYGCGKFTNEPDDICARCKGFSSIKKIKTSPPIEEEKKSLSIIKTEENGGERMKEKDYKSHAKCSVEGCIKYAVKDGLCTRDYEKEHGHVPYPKESKKKAKILPPPEIKVRKKEKLHAPSLLRDKSMPVKPSNEMNNLMERLIDKRDALKKEIIKIEATFVVLHDYAAVEIPELLVLNGQ